MDDVQILRMSHTKYAKSAAKALVPSLDGLESEPAMESAAAKASRVVCILEHNATAALPVVLQFCCTVYQTSDSIVIPSIHCFAALVVWSVSHPPPPPGTDHEEDNDGTILCLSP